MVQAVLWEKKAMLSDSRHVFVHLNYITIDELMVLIDPSNRVACKRILHNHRELFERAPGSTNNHHTWPGGYIDHVVDGMNLCRHLYTFLAATGRPLPFTISDALLVFFLHDLEKPWRILVDAAGEATNKPGLDTKAAFKEFREKKLAEYGIVLTEAQLNGLTYVEGEGNEYTGKRRVMNELATFCHMVDNWGARGWFNYPKPLGEDEWTGADRFRRTLPY